MAVPPPRVHVTGISAPDREAGATPHLDEKYFFASAV
eukprot:CAMPEP_0185790320 /NCGR_PEP_ID=MMETSP1174-20130828/155563_1 /TAXON_ID=35687 /ORGANISM="Dictyocha speculum, Strain CCMP1381" /LENGTH=36 /DNA_ID= /DNA_START= /DNA_END= /DNA_ORIENTATION=